MHLAAALVASVVAFGDEPTPAQIGWLKAHAVPFETVEAGSGFEDLMFLKEMIGDARVVGLGESTHGSREQFQTKHRLVEFLASEMGFTIFSIEASSPESFAVDEYVSHGEGDPVDLIRGMYFWTWSTEEMLDMVEWMREFNETNDDRHIRFTGFDMQTPDVAAEIVVDSVAQLDGEWSDRITTDYEMALRSENAGATWTSATGSIDAADAAGKPIVFRGKIKSRGVGYAALWFRADKDGQSVAFLNTMNQHQETDGWVEHVIELDIDSDADAVFFGLIHSGGGDTWFDDLSLTIDGRSYHDPDRFDFGCEEDGRGFRVMSREYTANIDTDVAAEGASSLHLTRVGQMPEAQAASPAHAEDLCKLIHIDLENRRDELADAIGTEEANWAVQMSRVVWQGIAMRAGGNGGGAIRDKGMADNVLWILEQNPGAKVILWAHNGHIANADPWQGSHLKRALGRDYVPIGFLTARGRYRAMSDDNTGLGNHDLDEPTTGSVESFFDEAGLDLAVLDVRGSELGSHESGWLHEFRPMRSIGALEMDAQFSPRPVYPSFELLIYTAETTPAVPIRAKWTDPPNKPE